MSSFRQLMMRNKGGGEHYETLTLAKNGSPTIVDGIVSGFSYNNYLSFYKSLNAPFEFKLKLKMTSIVQNTGYGFLGHTGSSGVMSLFFAQDPNMPIKSSVLLSTNSYSWSISDQTGTVGLDINTWFFFKLRFTGTQYISEISFDDVTYTQNTLATSSQYINSGGSFYICLGKAKSTQWVFSNGQIDLNESRFTFDGVKYKFEIA